MNCCIFGAFDPLTIGHEYIINEASKLFETVYVLVIKNNKFKDRHFDFKLCLNAIKDTFKTNNSIKIIEFDGDVENFIKSNNCDYLVRGIRNKKDFDFENFVYNRKFKNFVKVLYIKSPYKNVSSNIVYKQFLKNKINKNILPNKVYDMLIKLIKN